MKKRYKLTIVVVVLFMVVGVVIFLLESTSKSTDESRSRWTSISIEGGSMAGSWDVAIDDYGDGLRLNSWNLPSRPSWLGGFRAAKGMSGLSYEKFESSVSSGVLEGMGVKNAEDFEKFRFPGGGLSPDFVIYKVLYLRHGESEYALVSCWNNKDGSREDLIKRVQEDGRTKYLGSWLPLRMREQGFILISLEELAESGVGLFPYEKGEELEKIIENKKLIWDDVSKHYVVP